LVWTTIIFFTFPVMTDPFFTTELETTTAINCGTVGGGIELLPGWLVHVLPHVGKELPLRELILLVKKEILIEDDLSEK
jgi:hypothetical protein